MYLIVKESPFDQGVFILLVMANEQPSLKISLLKLTEL
jgi:hypothetical protein